MTMHDDELARWQEEWQDDAHVPDDVRRRAIADDRRYRAWVIAEYAATGLMLAGALAFALYQRNLAAWTMFVGFWGIGLPSLAFTVWSRRGLWHAADSTGRAFVALALARARRALRLVRMGYVVLGTVVLYNVAVFVHIFHAHDDANARNGILLTFALAAGMLAVSLVVHRRAARRLRTLEALSRELDL
jgi:hypothetical protein